MEETLRIIDANTRCSDNSLWFADQLECRAERGIDPPVHEAAEARVLVPGDALVARGIRLVEGAQAGRGEIGGAQQQDKAKPQQKQAG